MAQQTVPPMTSFERVFTVLNGGIPDHPPVGLHNFLMTAQASGLPFPEYLQNGEAMAEGNLRAWREFGQDILVLENGTTALAEACGCEAEYLPDSAPVLVRPVLRSLDDLNRLSIPNFEKVSPTRETLKTTQIVAREVGERAVVMGRADQGPFSLASMLLGVENFLLALSDPDQHSKLHALLEFSLEVVYRYAVAQIEHGGQITSIGESLAGPDVTSPRMYKVFEWPYACRLAERLKQKDIRLAYHICGNATRIVGDMAATGAAILELDYKCDLSKVKELTRGKAAILGVIDPSEVMARGTPETIAEKVREELRILGKGGGLIMGPGCALPPTTPHANIHAMIETNCLYGQYAPDGQLMEAG